MYPVQHPVDTSETNNINLPQRLAKFHKSPILGPEIMTNLGPLATTCRDPQQAYVATPATATTPHTGQTK